MVTQKTIKAVVAAFAITGALNMQAMEKKTKQPAAIRFAAWTASQIWYTSKNAVKFALKPLKNPVVAGCVGLASYPLLKETVFASTPPTHLDTVTTKTVNKWKRNIANAQKNSQTFYAKSSEFVDGSCKQATESANNFRTNATRMIHSIVNSAKTLSEDSRIKLAQEKCAQFKVTAPEKAQELADMIKKDK